MTCGSPVSRAIGSASASSPLTPPPHPSPDSRAGLTPTVTQPRGWGRWQARWLEGLPGACSVLCLCPESDRGPLLLPVHRALASCPHEGPGAAFSLQSPSPPHLGPSFLPDLARVP